MLNTDTLRDQIMAVGFTVCGFTRPDINSLETEQFTDWVEHGYAAEMNWLTSTAEVRANPVQQFPWAKSVICLGLAYDHPDPEDKGIVSNLSRYVRGRSYHNVMRRRLKKVRDLLSDFGSTQHISYADTGPVLERYFAQKAGLGWRGKNTLLINPEWGSYLFLGVVFTDLELDPDVPTLDHCGSCQRCLDACPTNAFVQPHVLDARKCISYLNIEHRSEFQAPYDSDIHGWLHGCDICQEVCPFVQRARRVGHIGDADFVPWQQWSDYRLEDFQNISETKWDELTEGSDVRRGGVKRIHRISERLLLDVQK